MKRTNFKMKTGSVSGLGKAVLLYLAIMSLALPGGAQTVLNSFPCPDGMTLPQGCPSRVYNITLELSSGTATAWSVTSGPAWFTRQSTTTTSAVFGTGAGSIPSGAAGNTFAIGVSANLNGGGTAVGAFNLTVRALGAPNCPAGFTVEPCLREIVYVLDKSGSMNADAEPGIAGSRWLKLKEVVESQLLTLGTLNLGLADSFDVALFGGSISRVTAGSFNSIPGINALIPATTVVSGGTPLGGGVQMALKRGFNRLGAPGSGKKRLIFLVSDGEQNMNPMVNTTTYSSVACDPARFPANGVTLTDLVDPALPVVPPLGAEVLNLNSTVNGDIERYHVGIGIGMTGAAHDLMNGSADKYESTLGVSDLDMLMDGMMTGTYLASSSPRVLDSRRGIINNISDPVVERFYVNDSVLHLTVKFFATDQHFYSAQVAVYKDGVEIFPKRTERPFLRLLHINFEDPKWADTFNISPTGIWEFRIRDIDPIPYRVTAFVEDKRIHHSLELGTGGKFYAGDPLPVRLKLRYRDTGMAGAKPVKAYLYRPGDDLGDLASDADAPKDLPDKEPGSTAAQAKIDFLVQQPDFYQRLLKEERIIDLVDEGNGEYTGVFTGNEVTGGYRVIVKLEGDDPVAKHYEGWLLEGAFYDFARPGDIRLNESISAGPFINKIQRSYLLTIKPTNQFGKKIGPGQSSRIRAVLSAGGQVTGDLVDNLDGSYSLPFIAAANANPTISVYVIDQQQPVKVFPLRKGQWGISLHAGLTLPQTNLDSLYSGSLFVEADVSYQLPHNLDLELVGGYYGFQSNFNVLGAALCLGYTPYTNPSNWYLRVAGGVGYYQPKNLDASVGYTGRLELGKSINSQLKLSLNGGYVLLADPELSFMTVGLGARWAF